MPTYDRFNLLDDAGNTSGPSFFPWLVQQIFVPLFVFLCLGATSAIPQSFSPGVFPPPRLAEDIWEMIVAWAAGFLLAVLVNRLLPRFATNGRFIWVLPSALLIMLICDSLYVEDVRQVLTEFFYPVNKNEEDLAFGFATLPTYACISYSLGILFSRARAVRGPRGIDRAKRAGRDRRSSNLGLP